MFKKINDNVDNLIREPSKKKLNGHTELENVTTKYTNLVSRFKRWLNTVERISVLEEKVDILSRRTHEEKK